MANFRDVLQSRANRATRLQDLEQYKNPCFLIVLEGDYHLKAYFTAGFEIVYEGSKPTEARPRNITGTYFAQITPEGFNDWFVDTKNEITYGSETFRTIKPEFLKEGNLYVRESRTLFFNPSQLLLPQNCRPNF
jgi:hypothetical protein